jgi:hypothetical protein
MYSRPIKEPAEVKVPVLYINGKETDYTRFPNWKEGAVIHLFNFYQAIQNSPSIAGRAFMKRFGNKYPLAYQRITPSQENIEHFPFWLAGFLKKCVNMEINSYQMGYRKYLVQNRQINRAGYEEIIRLDWHP